MTAYYSQLLTDPTANTTLVNSFKAPIGSSHARTRTSIGRCTGLFLTTDLVRMVTVKSGDRIHGVSLATDGACAAGAVNVGLWLSGMNHNGIEADAQLFATAVVVSTITDLVDVFDENTILDGMDRGRTVWELATISGVGANYTEDPMVQFDVCLEPSTSLTTAAAELTVQVLYTSGD